MKKLFVLLLGTIFLVSCNPAQEAYNDLEAFTVYLEEYSASFTAEEWDNAMVEYSTIIENIELQAYTDEERVAIGKLKGRCAVQFAKSSLQNAGEKLNDFFLEAEGFLQSFMDGFSNGNKDANQ